MITMEEMRRFCGPRGQEAWLKAFVDLAPEMFAAYGFTALDWQHFAGQWGHETNGLSLAEMRENMTFTTGKRIREVYSYRLRLALETDPQLRMQYGTVGKLAAALVRNPDYLADIVYGGREGTPWMDGSKYIGRGPMQITHLNNYRAIGAEIARVGGPNVDLVATPARLEEPEMGVRAAFADWHLKDLQRWARQDDVARVSAKLNTGSSTKISSVNGLDSRRRWTAKAKAVWPALETQPEAAPESEPARTVVAVGAAPPPAAAALATLSEGDEGEAVTALQRRLVALGYPVGDVDGHFGTLTRRALVAFQSEHALPADGIAGPATQAALAASAPADLGARATVTARDLAAKGSTQVSLGLRVKAFGRWLLSLVGLEAGGQATTGVSLIETGVGQAEKLGALAGRVDKLVGGKIALAPSLTPKLILLLAAIAAGILLWRWGGRIVADRVAKHRSGEHLSTGPS